VFTNFYKAAEETQFLEYCVRSIFASMPKEVIYAKAMNDFYTLEKEDKDSFKLY